MRAVDAHTHRLPLHFEALGDGHHDLQTVLSHPARVGGPGHRQHRIAVPHHDLHRVADDAQVHQHRSRRVLAGIGHQLTDRQLGQVHGTLRDWQTALGLDAREEADGEMAGAGNAHAVAFQSHCGLYGLIIRYRTVLTHGGWFHRGSSLLPRSHPARTHACLVHALRPGREGITRSVQGSSAGEGLGVPVSRTWPRER